MAHGLQIFEDGREIVYSSTPFNLFHTVKLINLVNGVHVLPLNNPFTPVGEVSVVFGSVGADPTQTISLGGTGASTYTVTAASYSGGNLNITIGLETSKPALSEIEYSFFTTRR